MGVASSCSSAPGNSHRVAKFAVFVKLFISFYSQIIAHSASPRGLLPVALSVALSDYGSNC